MLLTKEVEVTMCGKNIVYYKSLGYNIPTHEGIHRKVCVPEGTKVKVSVQDLPRGSSTTFIDAVCDCCSKTTYKLSWVSYNKTIDKYNGLYYCHACVVKNFSSKKIIKTKLNNTQSFYDWCVENNRNDVLIRWDYQLNKCNPNEICYCNGKKYYLKCPKNIHESNLCRLSSFVRGLEGSIRCKQCNSFAQWGIDNLGEDFLDKYWDYEKNVDINPWEIAHSSDKQVYIKCDKTYHGAYVIQCNNFVGGKRCPYCVNFHGKVHPLDSLGSLYPHSLSVWSEKNNKSPFEYAPRAARKVWWKCENLKHEDYRRGIDTSFICNFRCPKCKHSQGENEISNFLNNKNIKYIKHKTFDDLRGINNGKLSYDFYLFEMKFNILIEFQGEQHSRFVERFHVTKSGFEKQLEHDHRKREYAKGHKIKLLEIWYKDLDNIESILNKELLGDNK
jgi:hypothetical protein